MNNFSYSTKELTQFVENVHMVKQDLSVKKINKIGLTGASGFLGLHLISNLLNDPSIIKIKCFIRSKETFSKRKKLFNLKFSEDKLEFYFDFNEENTKDLDLFVHSAAQVHNIKKLSGLFSDNVLLTKKVVDTVQCPIVYISTLSVYASSNIQGGHTPVPCNISDEHIIYGGYAQSKWLGEYLMEKRKDTKIIRLGLLTPSTVEPQLQENEFLSLFLNLTKDFPFYPENFEDSFIDLSPIDLVSKEIIKSFSNDEKYIHIANKQGTSIKKFIEACNLTATSQEDWNKHLNSLKKTEKLLMSFAYFKSSSLKDYHNYFNIDLFQTTGHNWSGSINLINTNNYIQNIYEKV